MNADEKWLNALSAKVIEQHRRAEGIVAAATSSADTMRRQAQILAKRSAEMAAADPDAAAVWAELAAGAQSMAETNSSLAQIMTGFRNWIDATAKDIAATREDVAAAAERARRRVAEIRAADGYDDQEAAVAEILGETRATNGARIAGLRDWLPMPRQQ